MKFHPLATTLALVAAGCSLGPIRLAAAETEPGRWRPLMDGKTLQGWHAVGDGTWTVEDGAFVGRANNEKLYGLLVSDAVFGDFTVRFQFQCPSGDSGFYIRTIIKPPEKAHGLQIQVGPVGSGTGGIYESYGRAWLVKPTVEDEKRYTKTEGWNDVTIQAEGGHVVVHVNGVKTAELKDDPSRREGRFALQMHAGCVMEVKFRNIALLAK